MISYLALIFFIELLYKSITTFTLQPNSGRFQFFLHLNKINTKRLFVETKALSCKKEYICEHGPEAPSCPVGQGSFQMDGFKVEKCSMFRRVQIWLFFLEIMDAVLNKRETFQRVISVQFKSQHLWWYGVHTVWAACMLWKALWMLKDIKQGLTIFSITCFQMVRHLIHRAVVHWQATQFTLTIAEESHSILNVILRSLSAIYGSVY